MSMSKVSEAALFVMIFRQQFSKTLLGIRAKPCIKRSFSTNKTGESSTNKTGESSHAHNLLDKTPHRNLSFQIIKEHLLSGFIDNIDEFTVANALKACRGYPLLGPQIHGFSIIHQFVNVTIVSNSLMNMYCKSGQFCKALCIFEDLTHPDIVSWNTVLSGCQTSEDAFSFACKMNSSGVVFDAVTYTTVLSFCWRHVEAYFLIGLQLHSCIVKFGFDCEVFVGNALISMYSRWGHLVEARRVFEEMKTRDLVSWNAMISGYSQEGIYGLEAISMFLQMFRGGMELDRISFTSAVSACGYERNLELARQIHGLSIKTRHEKHVAVSNVLISTYFKCQVIEDARSVFQNMNERNVVSWTTMISIDEAEAVSFFNEMRLDGVYPNDVTFVGLIHAITIGELVVQGKMVHGFCTKTGFSSKSNVCNSIITMYAKFKSMQDSVKMFQELKYQDIIAWNALISGFVHNGLCQEAIRAFFSGLIESKPNQYSFGSILNAIGAAEDVSLKYGQRCHSQIIKLGLNTDPIVSSALLDMYAKRGSICESQKVFVETPQQSQFAWTTIISAYARHGDYESVMNWFEEMRRLEVRPDSITFLSILTACGRRGMVDMGCHLFGSMVKDYQIEPSAEHYSCLVDMLGRAGRLEEAERLMSHIPGGPGLSVLQSLLGACRVHGNVDMGERVADALMEMEPTESGSYVLMSNLYAEIGKWEMVAKVRKRMRVNGVKKEVGFSWVDVGGIDSSLSLHGFSSGDKSHPQSEAICRMAECLGFETKFLREEERECQKHSLMCDGDLVTPQ